MSVTSSGSLSPSSLSDTYSQTKSRFWVIIPAAGIGSRMQSDIPKQYLKIGSHSVLEYSVRAFLDHPKFETVYVGLSADDAYYDAEQLSSDDRIIRFTGGSERCDTVLNGLNEIALMASDMDWVWVHDAARPCLSQEDINKLIQHLELEMHESAGAILAGRVVDTIKVSNDKERIDQTFDRNKLWRAFTPQVFRFAALRQALSECQSQGLQVTDEASALEQVGVKPYLVEGSDENLKITRPNDLRLASSILAERFKKSEQVMMPRIGSGYDVHAFCEGDEIVLGGVKIPHKKAFLAHSDGDVLIHAVIDAMLGALALGDIGKHFPDTDERWKGANSRDLLIAVNDLISRKGYVVSNLDSVIIAQAPKMAPHIEQMRLNMANDLNVSVDAVSVKATTSERLGFTGREEGIACQASLILVPKTLIETGGWKVNDLAPVFDLKFPRANASPVASGVIKTACSDFFVEEMMSPSLSGEGEHVWLWLEKEGQNTEYVAGQIARFAQVKKMDVGFSGLKDRWAVTRQWFSVYLANKPEPDWSLFDCEGVEILKAARHSKKLRRGEHRANLFRIVIRDISGASDLDSQLTLIKDRGFPNYFGPQRFGFDGANLDRGVLFFEGKIKASKSQRSFYISAARSYLFNLNLARRVEDGSWAEESEGGPLYGDEVAGVLGLSEVEKNILDQHPSFKKGIHQNRLRMERRPYSVIPEDMVWQLNGDSLEVKFILPSGYFATSLLAEIFDLSQGLGEGNEGLRGKQ